MSEQFNSHVPRKTVCRQQRLIHHQLPIAIDIIESTERTKGEHLHGVIHWNKGLVIDEDRNFMTAADLILRQYSEEGPFYAFRYDGESLELFKH